MVDYPDMLNVRKLAFIFALGPLALLLLFWLIDVSIPQQSKVLKATGQSCAITNANGSVTRMFSKDCNK